MKIAFTIIFLVAFGLIGLVLFNLREIAFAHPNWKTSGGSSYSDAIDTWCKVWVVILLFIGAGIIELI